MMNMEMKLAPVHTRSCSGAGNPNRATKLACQEDRGSSRGTVRQLVPIVSQMARPHRPVLEDTTIEKVMN
jgi:hypothetical protein